MNRRGRDRVRRRARDRCEYCRLPQFALPEAMFHVEHIIAHQHGGTDDLENLALARDRCNLFKGPNLTAVDPLTQQVVRLFHPRHDHWREHFDQQDYQIIGLTDVGRTTARLLNMNAPRRVQLRLVLRLDLTSD